MSEQHCGCPARGYSLQLGAMREGVLNKPNLFSILPSINLSEPRFILKWEY